MNRRDHPKRTGDPQEIKRGGTSVRNITHTCSGDAQVNVHKLLKDILNLDQMGCNILKMLHKLMPKAPGPYNILSPCPLKQLSTSLSTAHKHPHWWATGLMSFHFFVTFMQEMALWGVSQEKNRAGTGTHWCIRPSSCNVCSGPSLHDHPNPVSSLHQCPLETNLIKLPQITSFCAEKLSNHSVIPSSVTWYPHLVKETMGSIQMRVTRREYQGYCLIRLVYHLRYMYGCCCSHGGQVCILFYIIMYLKMYNPAPK